jgi:hypothetical protein
MKPEDGTSRRSFLKQPAAAALAGTFLTPAQAAQATPDTPLATAGKARAAVVVGSRAASFYHWVARELGGYLRLLTGAEFPVSTGSQNTPGFQILVGGPDANEVVDDARRRGMVKFDGLKQDGFLLERINLENRPALIVGGNDEASTMYAAYDLLERLGIVFQITGDIIPERKPDLVLPTLQVRMEPMLKYRGLHIRHFVMPWIGMDYFRTFLGQMAKLKHNYLEFYWYVGGPWIEYSYEGEKRLIGDLYPRETGYTAWRINTATFTSSDVRIGRDHFAGERVCAPEFQQCETPEEAHRAARHLLSDVIDFAHERKIQVWLGNGDCPGVVPNLGRHAKYKQWSSAFGTVVSPGERLGADVWTAAISSMINTYPKADGYWLWLAEGYYHHQDPEAKRVIARYDKYRRLIPTLKQINELGYDQYFRNMPEEKQIESDLGLLHYGSEVVARVRQQHPNAKLGVSLLGRAYMFRAMDALFPKEIRFQSMESSICWNRKSRVPMRLFGGMGERERLIVPRLDDDESEFAMQFNVGLYDHDRVLQGSFENGVTGIAPQVGKLRGLEQNAKYLADGAWRQGLTSDSFYRGYVHRIFGTGASEKMLDAYRTMERLEMFLGLEAEHGESHFFLGLGNFLNYADTRDIRMMANFGRQRNPYDGPDFPNWNTSKDEPSPWISECHYRSNRFEEGLHLLAKATRLFRQSREAVFRGSRAELEYLIYKSESYTSHMETVRALLSFYIAYDRTFRARNSGDEKGMLAALDDAEADYSRARQLAAQTTRMVASNADDPTEWYILFRYNVRFLQPIEEFALFVRNIANFHNGRPYWQPVNWYRILPVSIR